MKGQKALHLFRCASYKGWVSDLPQQRILNILCGRTTLMLTEVSVTAADGAAFKKSRYFLRRSASCMRALAHCVINRLLSSLFGILREFTLQTSLFVSLLSLRHFLQHRPTEWNHSSCHSWFLCSETVSSVRTTPHLRYKSRRQSGQASRVDICCRRKRESGSLRLFYTPLSIKLTLKVMMRRFMLVCAALVAVFATGRMQLSHVLV